MDGLFPLRVWE